MVNCETKRYRTISRVGYKGSLKQKADKFLRNHFFRNYRTIHTVGSQSYTKYEALQLYEESYYEHFKNNPTLLDWLIETASDVYDNARSNIDSQEDYAIQETPSRHYQDIAVRRTLRRLGKRFKGDHLVQIRGPESEGYRLNPGVVPFLRPDWILKPARKGWWEPGSIEDFWQSNKTLQVSSSYGLSSRDEYNVNLRIPDERQIMDEGGFSELKLLCCSFQTEKPTIYGKGKRYGDSCRDGYKWVAVESAYPFNTLVCLPWAAFYYKLSTNYQNIDLLMRTSEQLPRNSLKIMREFAKKIIFIS